MGSATLSAITLVCLACSMWVRPVTWTCRWEAAALNHRVHRPHQHTVRLAIAGIEGAPWCGFRMHVWNTIALASAHSAANQDQMGQPGQQIATSPRSSCKEAPGRTNNSLTIVIDGRQRMHVRWVSCTRTPLPSPHRRPEASGKFGDSKRAHDCSTPRWLRLRSVGWPQQMSVPSPPPRAS